MKPIKTVQGRINDSIFWPCIILLLFLMMGCDKTPKGDKQYSNSLGMKFVPVPGLNIMFSIYETRRGDYAKFVNETGHTSAVMALSFGDFKSITWDNPGFSQTDDHPVVEVSYESAMEFCKWLTDTDRKKGLIGAKQYYRLPTSEEWSKALQGTKPDLERFPWGNSWPPPPKTGNFFDSSNGSYSIKDYTDRYNKTAPVGSFAPNSIGLYDMSGNVSELCEDVYHDAYHGEDDNYLHVLRGGSFMSSQPEQLESKYIYGGQSIDYTIGFRCVLVMDGSLKK